MEELYAIYQKYPRICTDTRAITKDVLFFCLRGENFDGNTFALKALENGAAYVVTEDQSLIKNQHCIVVDNVLDTLQKLAHYHRKQLPIKIIGITGTNGKTTTKELTAAVLSKKYRLTYTQGNLNNHIGVPLTLLSIKPSDEVAIVEMGANHPGEIAQLCEIVEPDFGIITNIGIAHIEGFLSVDNIILTKKALYKSVINSNGTLFVNENDDVLMENLNYHKVVYYGKNSLESIHGKITKMNPFLCIQLFDKEIETHLTGAYNFNNLLCAATVGHFFDVDEKDVLEALSSYQPNNNRSQLIKQGNNTIIADFYNANPSSMMAALNNFVQIESSKKVVILGDMRELGSISEEEHEKIIEFCENYNLESYFIGQEFFRHCATKHHFFHTPEEANAYFVQHPISNAFVLIKGSRGVHLEKIVVA